MKYMLLIYADEVLEERMSPAEQEALFQAYDDYTRRLQAAVAVVASHALQPTATATTVRWRDGQALTTDGPFAETKEQLGGYYIIDCDNLDEAIEWAAQVPSARYGSVEIRPVMTFD